MSQLEATIGAKAESFLSGKDISYYVHAVISLFLMFFFGKLVPPIGTITPMGMEVLGVFIGLLYGWIFVDLLWTSLISFVALGLTEFGTMKEVFAAGLGHEITLMVLFFMTFAAYLDKVGLTSLVAKWFITRKAVEGKPWVFVVMLFLASFVLGATVTLYPTMIIVWAIFGQIAHSVGFEPKARSTSYLVLGIGLSAMLGFSVFPFLPFGLLSLSLLQSATGLTVNYATFTLFTFTICMISTLLFIVIGRFIFRIDLSPLAHVDHKAVLGEGEELKMNKEQKTACVFFVLFLLMMFLPGVLPKEWVIAQFLNRLGLLGGIVIMISLLCGLQRKGQRLAHFGDLSAKGLSWDIFFLIGATMPLGAALESKESGIIEMIMVSLKPMLSGVSPFVFLALSIAILSVATQVAHNLVLVVVFTPFLCQLAVEMGANPIVLAVIFPISLQMALITPASSAQGAMIHANPMMGTKYAYAFGSVAVVVVNLLVIFLGIPFGNLLFG